ncbi:TetR/AcrR family transcriptional regulator [Streptomyces sp. NPDC047706]|uniref:TetR/AcrR family transcriptional regulator n=1 Tax=Streptomyces sp. NPDC047706 TaxID=3365486 RepID=UPI0037181AE7
MPSERDILHRGLEAFAELGYDRASVRELSGRLHVSHNFLNDRYGSKAAFWRATVDFALQSQLGRMPPVDPAASDEDVLRQVITSFYRTTLDWPHLGRLCVDESSRDTDRLDYLFDSYIAPMLATIEPSVERLIASGRMAPMPIDVLFFAMIGPLLGLVQAPLARRLGRPDPASRQEQEATAESLASLVINGLLATRTPGTRTPPGLDDQT